MKMNKELRDASGRISSSKKLVSFLYDLGRDHLPLGKIQQLVQDAQKTPVEFSNGWLAQYAEAAAEALEDPEEENENLVAAIAAYERASMIIGDMPKQTGKACRMALEAHQGQRYGDYPYHVHLMSVVTVVKSFSRMLVPDGYFDILLETGAWLHDTIEDTTISRDQIEQEFGTETANLVWSVTGVGSNRGERIESIHQKLKNNPLGCILKLADRVANVEQCKKDNPGMLEKYRKELPEFRKVVQPQVPLEAWERLEAAFQ